MNGATDELLATLLAAETALRAAAAEVLSPAALMRVERNSTRRARAAVAEYATTRRHELPVGWSEFVEADAHLEALLDRLVPVDAPPALAPQPEPEPESVSTWVDAHEPVVVVPEPEWVIGVDGMEPTGSFTAVSAATEEAGEPVEEAPVEVAQAPVDDEPVDELVDEPTESRPAATAGWDDDQAWVSYEPQPEYLDDDEDYVDYVDPAPAAGEDVAYVVYTEPAPVHVEAVPVEDEPLPEYAVPLEPEEPAPPPPTRSLRKPPPAPAPRPEPVEEDPGEEQWAAVATPAAESTRPEAYAALRSERMRLDDFSTLEPREEARTPRRPATPAGPAAIQLSAQGARVLGQQEEDDEPRVIELGDTSDYGDEEVIEDDQTGVLGVGVVEYDEVEEIEELEEVDDGLESLPGAPELTPAEISALCARAQEAGRRNMAEGALLYGDVLDADPTRVDAMLARGRLLLDLGDFPGAISDFLKAEALQPRDPDVQVALGDLYAARKDYGKAVSYYNRALSLDGDHALALARRGMAHYYRKQFDAAVEDLERAKKLDPNLPHIDTYLPRARKRK